MAKMLMVLKKAISGLKKFTNGDILGGVLNRIPSILLFMVIGGLFTYFIICKKSTILQTIKINDFDSLTVVQDARLGYITEDSLKILLGKTYTYKTKINWKDSVLIRDSLIIHNSTIYDTIITNVPIYEADSSYSIHNTKKYKSGDSIKIDLYQTLYQRFFPKQEMFASQVNTDSLNINFFKKEESRFGIMLYGGYGTTITDERIRFGWQAGIGFGYHIDLIKFIKGVF